MHSGATTESNDTARDCGCPRLPRGKANWKTRYEHTDALHSPNTETDAAGTATRIEHYTPYGEPGDGRYVQGPGYTGHVTDAATGLTYAQQRYYDPVLGRFLSVDPVLPNDNGGSFNRYWYANNNPIGNIDPDGRYVCKPSPCSSVVKGGINDIRMAKLSSIRGGNAYRTLGAIENFYGASGKANGVTVVEVAAGGNFAFTDRETGEATIQINTNIPKGFTNNGARGEAAATLAHEGQHGVDERQNRLWGASDNGYGNPQPVGVAAKERLIKSLLQSCAHQFPCADVRYS